MGHYISSAAVTGQDYNYIQTGIPERRDSEPTMIVQTLFSKTTVREKRRIATEENYKDKEIMAKTKSK